MSDDDLIEEFLNRWEDLREAGLPAVDEEICAARPDLLPEFRRRTAKLKKICPFLDGDMIVAPDELTAAGRYRPLELFAHGGLGEVFRARDDELGREVALKRIRAQQATDVERAARFQFEAEITGRLDHPGVVPVYGLGHDASGRLYYAMRFIRGETLQDAIDAFHRAYPPGKLRGAGSLAFQKLIRGFLAVCNTIAYAHSQDVIHRDLKPANIMLGSYGETLVVDWGLAKRVPRAVIRDAETLEFTAVAATTVADQTMFGQIKGSPAYMSPEQAEGRTDRIGPRSDIYSLGATLYTILAGTMPFAKMPLHELLDRVKRADFLPPRAIRGDMPAALEAVCLKAMSLNQADRYATALEMAADLERWLADDPVAAWREPWTARASRWMRKHQTLTSTVAAAVVVALLGISALAAQQVVLNGKERAAREAAEKSDAHAKQSEALAKQSEAQAKISEAAAKESAEKAHRAQLAAEASEKNAQRELYAFRIVSADRALDSGDRDFARRSLDACPEPSRNVEWRLLYRRAMGSRRTWQVSSGAATSVALSPDGKLIAAAASDGPVRIWNRADNTLVAELAGPASQVAFAADSDHLIVHAQSGITVPLRDGGSFRANSPDWNVELWSVSQRKRISVLSLFSTRFVVSGDRKRLAVIGVDWPQGNSTAVTSGIDVFELPGGKRLASAAKVAGEVSDITFSPDHHRLYSVVRQIGKAASQTELKYGLPPLDQDESERFRLQAWDSIDGNDKLKQVYSKEGPENADATAVTIAPDGKQIVVTDKNRQFVPDGPHALRVTAGRVLTFDAGTGEPVKAAIFDLDAPDAVPVQAKQRPLDIMGSLEVQASVLAISPDGKRMAVAVGYRVLVFDMHSGDRLRELTGHLAVPQCIVFAADSQSLFTAGGKDGSIKQWDLARPLADRSVVESEQASRGRGIAFSGDSSRYAVSAAGGAIGIYDTATSRQIMLLPPISTAVPQDKLRDVSYLYPMHDPVKGVYGVGCEASDIRISADGKRLTAVYDNRLICVWDLSGEKPVVVDFLDELALEPKQFRIFTHLLLSPDGKYLASESHRNTDDYYRVWEIAKRRLVIGHEKDDYLSNPQMMFTRDNRYFYLERGSPRAQPAVLGWDLETGKPVDKAGTGHLLASPDQLSPDGARELAITGGVLQLIDHQTGHALIEYSDWNAYIWAIFSPDGKYILACKDKTAELLDATPLEQP